MLYVACDTRLRRSDGGVTICIPGCDGKLPENVERLDQESAARLAFARASSNITVCSARYRAPSSNAIVISKELQSQYKLALNDTIIIGQFIGSIVGIIDSEPDINVQSLALGPRVYTSLNNSLKTGFNHVR